MLFRSGFHQIKETGRIRLFKSDRDEYADGEQKRDFFYVKDAVEMTLWLLENRDANGIFNLGTGRAETWNDLARALFKAMNVDENIEYIDMPDHLKGKYQYYTKAEIDKIREAGYDKPIMSLEDAVADYVKNYLEPGKTVGEADSA